jgi:hypothetical protein
MSRVDSAVEKFLGGFHTLKNEISQLKQTVLENQ